MKLKYGVTHKNKKSKTFLQLNSPNKKCICLPFHVLFVQPRVRNPKILTFLFFYFCLNIALNDQLLKKLLFNQSVNHFY